MKSSDEVNALRLSVEGKLSGGLEPNKRRWLQGAYAALCWVEGVPCLASLQVEGLAGWDGATPPEAMR